MDLLQDALDKITYKDAVSLERGETLILNESYGLYLYEEGESMVVMDLKDNEEIYWVQYNPKFESIEYGSL